MRPLRAGPKATAGRGGQLAHETDAPVQVGLLALVQLPGHQLAGAADVDSAVGQQREAHRRGFRYEPGAGRLQHFERDLRLGNLHGQDARHVRQPDGQREAERAPGGGVRSAPRRSAASADASRS